MKCETVAEAFFLRGTLTQRYNTKTDTNTKIQDKHKHKHTDTTQRQRLTQDIHFLNIAFDQLGAILKMPFFNGTVQKGDGHTDHWSGQPQT